MKPESEIEILSNLHHPNIIHMHEVFQCSDQLKIVMELVKGRNLQEWIMYSEDSQGDEAEYQMSKVLR